MRDFLKPAAGLGLAAALALSVVPAAAGPMVTGTSAVKAAVADEATQVRWRGHGWRGHSWVPGAVAGLAAGAVIGGALATAPYYAAPYHGYAYDSYPYAYAEPYGYSYAPTYYYGHRRDGYFNRSCSAGYDSSGAPC
jgi:hypothetical protein